MSPIRYRDSLFSYQCRACGRCCHDQVITLAPYDLMRLADVTALSTAAVIARFTLRRGSLLRFGAGGACMALAAGHCSVHEGRPLACRLYPLGLERSAEEAVHADRFIEIEAVPGSEGIYGAAGLDDLGTGNTDTVHTPHTVDSFLRTQGVGPYLAAVESYRGLIERIRARIAELVDFEKHPLGELRRVAIREALAETNYAPNPLIDASFDSDRLTVALGAARSPARHAAALACLMDRHPDSLELASAAALLAVSLGYSPGLAFEGLG